MKKTGGRITAFLLAFLLAISLLPAAALAFSNTVRVRIIGEDSILLDTMVNVDGVTDCTQATGDSSTSLNALDAVLCATLQNSYDSSSYDISYNAKYGSYSLSKIAGITPSENDYWGTLAVSASGGYDGGALSAHALTPGDTYIVYYDQSLGGYQYQTYAWFSPDTTSGTTGSAVPIEVQSAGYGNNGEITTSGLSGATVYATGGEFSSATPVAVTDSSGKAYLLFAKAGTYTLTLPTDDTYAACSVSVTGADAALSDVSVHLTGGAGTLSHASLTVTDSAGSTVSPYSISADTFSYRLPDGTYRAQAGADGYGSSSETLSVAGTTSQVISLTPLSGHTVTITPANPADETVTVKSGNGAVQAAVSNAGGIYTYDLADGNYTYTVSRSGYHSLFGSFTVSGADQSITTAVLTDQAAGSAEWPAFRNFSSNMALSSYAAPRGSWQAEEAWATSLGSLGSYGTLSVSNPVLYDGYLYAATEHGLSKIEKSTGTLLTTTALSTGASYAAQIAYGDGKIFVTTGSGIDAFDALTMERVWSAPISAYGHYMAATPILYDDASKTIYVGDDGDGNGTLGTYGGYSAINAQTGQSRWVLYGGSTDARYWAGAVIAGDYVVFGSDSGTLTSVKQDTADINAYGCLTKTADTLSVTGKIRSSIAYDGTDLYFTTSSGYLYQVSIDSGTGALSVVHSRQFTSGSTSTPVVWNGRIYVGANDGIYTLKADDLSQVFHYATDGAVQSSALLTTAYSGNVYAYFTVNSPRGEVVVLSDNGTDPACSVLYTPSRAQYSFASPIADSDGTLYDANDSGYVFAIRNNGKSDMGKVKTTISVSPSSLYDAPSYSTAYPAIKVKDSGGTVISTAAAGFYDLPAGSYSYTVSLSGYQTASGSFTVTAEDAAAGSKAVSVTLTTSSGQKSSISATVSVIGSDNHFWISRRSVTVSNGDSAWTAIKKALDSAGLSYTAKETALGTYLSSVNGLAEFDKGANSGWLYSVDGKNPTVGVDKVILSDGNQIILYYTQNYTEDTGAMGGTAAVSEISTTASLNKNTGVASATLSGNSLTQFNQSIQNGSDAIGSTVTITVSIPTGADALELTLPRSSLTALGNTDHTSLLLETGFAGLTFDPNLLDAIAASSGGKDLTLSIAKADTSRLSDSAKERIGGRPAYCFSMDTGGTKITDFSGGKASVSIPYVLQSGEDANAVVAYYIDSSGTPQAVRGAYHAKTGTMDFTVSHFSEYAVGYHKITFTDAADAAWYANAVNFCAARDITLGDSNNRFGPEHTLTRGQSIVMLMRAYGLDPDQTASDNFSDAGNTYYTNYLSAAKRLGITNGIGGNQFSPDREISRQELFTMLYRVLGSLDELPSAVSGNGLANYTDSAEISGSAKTAMEALVAGGIVAGTNGKLNPEGFATRAQMAEVLYRLLSA